MSRGRYGVGKALSRSRRTVNRCLKAVHCSGAVTTCQARGSQLSRPSTLTLIARSVANKAQLIQDLILEKDADLACITETWMGSEGGVPLSLARPPGYAMQHQGRLEGRGGELPLCL